MMIETVWCSSSKTTETVKVATAEVVVPPHLSPAPSPALAQGWIWRLISLAASAGPLHLLQLRAQFRRLLKTSPLRSLVGGRRIEAQNRLGLFPLLGAHLPIGRRQRSSERSPRFEAQERLGLVPLLEAHLLIGRRQRSPGRSPQFGARVHPGRGSVSPRRRARAGSRVVGRALDPQAVPAPTASHLVSQTQAAGAEGSELVELYVFLSSL